MHPEKINIDSYLRSAKDKYTYFLLAVSASAIAFTITQTKTSLLSWVLLPLALSVISWGASFYFGCKCAQKFQLLLQDSAYLYESEGSMNNMPETEEQIIEILGESYSENLVSTKTASKLQFWFLISGGILFLIWHVTKIILRSI